VIAARFTKKCVLLRELEIHEAHADEAMRFDIDHVRKALYTATPLDAIARGQGPGPTPPSA
jgi:hypothetical protein